MTESELQARILLRHGAKPDIRLFRNTVGFGFQGDVVSSDRGVVVLENARPVTFGLATGSPDVVGWQSVVVAPEMVGQRVAIFAGLEVKTQTGRASKPQVAFGRMLSTSGGRYGLIRTLQESDSVFLK